MRMLLGETHAVGVGEACRRHTKRDVPLGGNRLTTRLRLQRDFIRYANESPVPEPKNGFVLSLRSSTNADCLTFTIVDPIFSDRQQQTFPDLFWLSNYLWELILKDMEQVNTFLLI